MHTDTQSGHVMFPLPLMFFIYFSDQGITLNGRQSDHIQNLSRCCTTLLTHLDTADTISADFINRVYPEKRSQFFGTILVLLD